MAQTAKAFDGKLNSNEIYNALFNLNILFQKLAPQTIKRDEIISLVEKSAGSFGDTGVVQGMDIQGTYDFGLDAEAPKLLAVNRNKTQKVEKFVINNWRQTDVTNDAYISKRAFLDEGSFELFNSYVVGTLGKAMDAFESGHVKAGIGTYASPLASCTITVTLPPEDGTEATERIRASKIKRAIMDLKADLADNQRKYNGYGFYASYDWDEFTPIMSSKYLNEINALALPTVFNPDLLKSGLDGHIWTPKWFGDVKTTSGTSDGLTIHTLVEMNSDGTKTFPLTSAQITAGVVRLFPGDLIPNAIDYAKGEAYSVNDKVIAKVLAPEYVYYMTGYQQGESFHNPRSGTDNFFLRKGFSDVQVSQFRPFITIVEDDITIVEDEVEE